MSNGRRGPPPPSSAHQTDTICACRRCPGIEIVGDQNAAPLKHVKTDLASSKDASIEAHYDQSKHRAIVYLDAGVLLQTKLAKACTDGEGFYKSTKIYGLVIDALEGLQQDTQRKEMLKEVKEATAGSIRLAIEGLRKIANTCLSCCPEVKEDWVLKVRKLRTILLHGEECIIWRKKDRICRGKLSFCKFSCFSVEGEGDPVFFRFLDRDILSNKYRIEKATGEETKEDYVEVS